MNLDPCPKTNREMLLHQVLLVCLPQVSRPLALRDCKCIDAGDSMQEFCDLGLPASTQSPLQAHAGSIHGGSETCSSACVCCQAPRRMHAEIMTGPDLQCLVGNLLGSCSAHAEACGKAQ